MCCRGYLAGRTEVACTLVYIPNIEPVNLKFAGTPIVYFKHRTSLMAKFRFQLLTYGHMLFFGLEINPRNCNFGIETY